MVNDDFPFWRKTISLFGGSKLVRRAETTLKMDAFGENCQEFESTNWKLSRLEILVNRMKHYVQRAAASGLLSTIGNDLVGEQGYNECVLSR